MTVAPSLLLIVVVAVTAAALIASTAARNARAAQAKAWAAEWKMAYTADDRFQLTPRVAAQFPIPGVADVVLRDLVYARHPTTGAFHYLFTVEYTTGVLRAKHRRTGVALLVESATEPRTTVTLAPPDRPIREQYAHLRDSPS